MKHFFSVLALGFVFAQPVLADSVDAEVEAAAAVENAWGYWSCSAQAPRLIRVFTVKAEDYRDEVQQEALDNCNDVAVFQCWPLGCHQPNSKK